MSRALVDERAYIALQRLRKFWTFKRRTLAAELDSYLASAQALLYELEDGNTTLSEQLTKAKDELALCASASEREQENIRVLRLALDGSSKTNKQLKDQNAYKDEEVSILQSMVTCHRTDVEALQSERDEVKIQLLTLWGKFELVSSLLSVHSRDIPELNRFEKLVNKDFVNFACEVTSLVGEAHATMDLQTILEELRLVVGFPDIAYKTKVVVAGGFSAGKSAFINSLIGYGEVSLAEGINPVTVVPSYVISAKKLQIKGYSSSGGYINLDKSLYEMLSHEYIQTFGFDIRRILPFVSIETPMQAGGFKHLCFVDTPGYDAGNSDVKVTEYDKATTRKLVNKASALIWVMSIEDGTINNDGLEFIKTAVNQSGRSLPLFVVLNKADKRPRIDIENIIDDLVSSLDHHDIEYYGICAYSSRKKIPDENRIFACRGKNTMKNFLESLDNPIDAPGRIQAQIDKIFDRYSELIKKSMDLIEGTNRDFNKLKLDILEIGGVSLRNRMDSALSELADIIRNDAGIDNLHLLLKKNMEIRKELLKLLDTLVKKYIPNS